MIHLKFKHPEEFHNILEQLVKDSGIYAEREAVGNEFGSVMIVGEKLNVYYDLGTLEIRVLEKPQIDG